MASFEHAFMEMVQLHERTWGMEQYPGRPQLAQLLQSPVVIMWVSDVHRPGALPTANRRTAETIPARFMFSVHQQIDEINDALLGLIISAKQTPNAGRRLARIFINKKPIKVKGVRLLLDDE